MLRFTPGDGASPLDVLAIGAHADDIEIGCGGTIMQLARDREVRFHWVVVTGDEERAAEAQASARAFCAGAIELDVRTEQFRESYLPYEAGPVKSYVQSLAAELDPDLVFVHHRDDLHQDHRLLADLCWNAFRDHAILEYEIPKYDGDLGRPNVFMEIDQAVKDRKLELLASAYPSQADRYWFSDETFTALLRLRGVEARAASGYAEAFHARKLRIAST
jgi:LmbE family N-acetylglucosaminyl deacetylase